MGKVIVKNICPSPVYSQHQPVVADARFNRKPLRFTLHNAETGTVEGNVRVCKNCGALYAEADG